jgi:cleavage stimulation factor subunit 2
VRNLKDVHVSGRALRVELSTDEPGPKKNNPSNSAPNGNGPPNGNRFPGAPSVPAQGFQPFQPPPANSSFPANSRTQQPPYGGPTAAGGVQLNLLPPGQEVPPGERATDVISKTLASIPPGKLEEVLLGMKTMVKEDPEGAKKVFQQHPQLAYALFQAMLLMNAVDPSVLQVSDVVNVFHKDSIGD